MLLSFLSLQYYVSDNRFVFVDVSAGPVVVSTDSDVDNIHNIVPYEFAYG